MSSSAITPITLALPKGRLLDDALPLLAASGIDIDDTITNDDARRLLFASSMDGVSVARVRSFDVASFVAFGGADVGIVGSDVLMEFDYPELYMPTDLGIGQCRLVVAESQQNAHHDDPQKWSRIRVATKYPRTCTRYFSSRSIQVECIKLHGAVELAIELNLCPYIVDLVSSGRTLRQHQLVEVETIAHVSARLIVNRVSLKTKPHAVQAVLRAIRDHITTVEKKRASS